MRNWVNEWRQEGQIYIWRYSNPNRSKQGWHFAGDEAGCRSIRNLLDRMRGGETCHRTLQLLPVPEAVWSVPNFGKPQRDIFSSMRIQFIPEFSDLGIEADDQRVTLRVGDNRIGKLASAFAAVEVGDGDFGIPTSDKKKAETWMFWWM